MNRENTPAVLDSAPTGRFESMRKSLVTKAALFSGALVSAATLGVGAPNRASAHPDRLASTPAAHPLEYVGVTSNKLWVPDLSASLQAAHDIAATNANTVRIFQPYNLSQAEFSYDLPRLCNAAEAARENGLNLEVSFIGIQKVQEDGKQKIKHNYVPSNAGAVSRYLNVVKTIIMDVAGPNTDKSGPNGKACVNAPLDQLMIEDLNEVNSASFNSNTDAPKKYAYLVSKSTPAYDKIEQDINQAFQSHSAEAQPHQFKLVHAVGALAAGSHDPIGFLRDFDKELKSFGVQNPDFLLAVHPYPSDPSSTPAQVEANLYPLIKSEIDFTWPKNSISVFYDEFGIGAISNAKRSLYGSRSLSAATVSEGTQAQYYHDAFVEAASEDRVVGGLTFQSEDVRDDGWPTGILSPDGSHKNSWNTVALTFHDALAGTLQK